MHDVLDLRDIVGDELEQLRTSGHTVDHLDTPVRDAVAARDDVALERLLAELGTIARDPAWPYDEPLEESAVLEQTYAVDAAAVEPAALPGRVHGAWLGRAIGNTLGKPVEGLTRQEVETYLKAAGMWPQTGYMPLLDPLPAGVSRLHPSAPIATAGRFTDVPRDDDIDWTILNLFVLERYGDGLSTDDILREWLDRVPFTQTYTAERAAYRNALHGLRPPDTAARRNPYREWIGALIRGDAFGYVRPGDPGAAARLAMIDARLSHSANGLYGELWAAALVASALAADSADQAVQSALQVVPPGSRLADALRSVRELWQRGAGVGEALDWIDATLGDYSWVHTINNAAIIESALLWGAGFMDSVAIAVSAGRDTDSTAATVGSVVGALHGEGAIPGHLVHTTPVTVRSAVRDFDRITIDELVDRTLRLVPSYR
ncbi:MAG TPA: ADP-ribosylglycohydrolase family protein [Candidatus Limnocylindria bacterium]